MNHNSDMNNKMIIASVITLLLCLSLAIFAAGGRRSAKNPVISFLPSLVTKFPKSVNKASVSVRPVATKVPLDFATQSLLVEKAAKKTAPTVAGCGIVFTADSNFHPTKCQFKKIIPDESCVEAGTAVTCPPSHIIELTGATGENKQISVFSFQLREGDFTFGKPSIMDSFIATLINRKNSFVNLQSGKMTLQLPVSGKTANVSLDLKFANGARISGSGNIPRVTEELP